MPDPWDELNFWCDYCGAQPGRRCITRTTEYCSPHVSRTEQANEVWKQHHPERVKGTA